MIAGGVHNAARAQSWGGYMSMLADPEGNVFYLDQLR
jgi:uncharacterized glyoxalase superfamily protein PhnB